MLGQFGVSRLLISTCRRLRFSLTFAASSSPSFRAYLLFHCILVNSSFLTDASKLSSAFHLLSSCLLSDLLVSRTSFDQQSGPYPIR